MTKKVSIVAFTAVIVFFVSCSSVRIYRRDDKGRITIGILSDSVYDCLKKYLSNNSQNILKDTIIIKYDYNYETCWSGLDHTSKEEIMYFLNVNHTETKRCLVNRNNVIFFNFREPGSKVNKVKKWDSNIIIDTQKTLYHLLFYQRSCCGSSILVMPDKKYIYLRSDAHYGALKLTQEEINAILK